VEDRKMANHTGRRFAEWLLVAAALPTFAVPAHPESVVTLEVGKFSLAAEGQALPEGWKPLTFPKVPKHTA
jgi:hypothetical protein